MTIIRKRILILIVTTFILHSTSACYGIDEEFEHFLSHGGTSQSFLKTMKKYWKVSQTPPDHLNSIEQNEQKIYQFIEENNKNKFIIKENSLNAEISVHINAAKEEKNVGALEEQELIMALTDLKITEQDCSDALQAIENPDYQSLKRKESIISEPKETAFKTIQVNQESISSALKTLKKKNSATHKMFIDLIKETRNCWVSLYNHELSKSNEKNMLNKASFLYCFKAMEFANILRKEGYAHQHTDKLINFPELCCTFAQQAQMYKIKQQLIVAGLRALDLKDSIFSPEGNEHFEEIKVITTIDLLKELNNVFSTCIKPIESLKKMSIVEDDHPFQASVNYKLMSLYKRLSCLKFIYWPSLEKTLNKSDIETEISNIGFQAIVYYKQILPQVNLAIGHYELIPISAIYYERIIAILDRLGSWIPQELWKANKFNYRILSEESNNFLARFYKQQRKFNKQDKPTRYDFTYKAAIYFNCAYNCSKIKFQEGDLDAIMNFNKKKASKYANDYLSYIQDNILQFDVENILDRFTNMYRVAKGTSEDKHFPLLEQFLASMYVQKVEDNKQENVVVKSGHIYNSAKYFDVFDESQAVKYAEMYIVFSITIERLIIEKLGAEEKHLRATHMYNIFQRMLTGNAANACKEARKVYFDPDSLLNTPEELAEHVDESSD